MKDIASHAAVAKPETTARTRQIVCNELRWKWGKFSDQDLSLSADRSWSENLPHFNRISLQTICLVLAAVSGFATAA